MRKLFTLFLSLIVAMMLICPIVHADSKDMWAQVYKLKNTNIGDPVLEEVTSGITFKVLQRNSDTAETLTVFGDDTSTSLTNPVTTSNFASASYCKGRVQFRVDPGEANDTYVDLIVVDTAGGYTALIEDFTQYEHKIIIDERPNIMHHGCIWFGASDNTETDTSVDIIADSLVHDVRVEVVTVDATETIDVGLLSTETAGDANGFRAAVSVATAGFVADTAVITNGSNIDYTAASTYGALLVTAITGSDAVATCGGKSYLGHVVTASNATSITYTGSAGSDTAAGYIHYFFTRMR